MCAASSLQETMAEQEELRVALLSALQVGTTKKPKLIEPIVTFLIVNDVESVADLGGIDASKLSKGVKPDEVQIAWLKRGI